MNSSHYCHHHKFPDCLLPTNDLPYSEYEANNIIVRASKPQRHYDQQAYLISTCHFSANILSMILGLYTGCLMLNRIGRRDSVAVSTLPNIVGWLCVIIFDAQDMDVLFFIGQIINSFGVGMAIITSLVYSVEICNRTSSTLLTTIFSLSALAGLLLAWHIHIEFEPSTIGVIPEDAPYPYTAPDVIELIPHSELWVVLGMTGILIAIVALFAAFNLPESPAWLVQNDQYSDATSSLRELRSELHNDHAELEELKHKEATSQQIDTSYISALWMLKECWSTTTANQFLYTVMVVFLAHSSGINVIYSYFETSFEYNFEHRAICTVTFCIVACNIIMGSWILGHVFTHRHLYIISCFITSLGCICFTLFLYLGLEKLKLTFWSFYLLQVIFVGQCFAAAQLIPIFKYVALVPSRLHPYAAFITLALAVLAFFFVSILKPHIDYSLLFTYFSFGNIFLLLVVCCR